MMTNILINNSAHIREQEKPVICPYCNKRMAYQSDMRKHTETHLKAVLRERFPCPICKESFTKHVNMMRHKKKQHDDVIYPA
ncbi:hypothetical protein EDB82DRAFT_1804 [Fusarium venenatum]|uniref:uncharacterized protein n=1 Tax=Fusarium venenatum TaxID=56646 RepID=UPI001E0FFF9E|nr:hypothetical protein EDB82DRAFT_1804 [Fusarium venenatum]